MFLHGYTTGSLTTKEGGVWVKGFGSLTVWWCSKLYIWIDWNVPVAQRKGDFVLEHITFSLTPDQP